MARYVEGLSTKNKVDIGVLKLTTYELAFGRGGGRVALNGEGT